MATTLPYDIVGRIIDILAAEGDLTPIKNASLTSSSVLHLCRRHIFHTVSSYSSSIHGSLNKPLIEILVNNPDIVQYIRELNYYESHVDSELFRLAPLLRKFFNLLQTISLLECLRFRFVYSDVNWTEIDPLLRSTLLHLIHLPTLTHLDISHVRNIPISAFAPCINLEQLDIRYITLAPFEDQDPSLRMSCSKTPRILHFKNVGSNTADVERLLRAKWKDGRPVLDFTHIKTLEVETCMFRDVQLTQELFENISYLEEVRVNAQNATDSLAGLSETISVNARNWRTLHFKPGYLITGLCEELNALARNKVLTVLQVLKFTIRMDGNESKALVENMFRTLEEVLMDPGWSALVCVSIEVEVQRYFPPIAGLGLELNSVPEMYLGRLSSRKILSYKWANFRPVPYDNFFSCTMKTR